MDIAAQKALQEAIEKLLALEMFPVIEVALLVISIILALFVVHKYVGPEATKPLSPVRFGVFTVLTLGVAAYFTVLWGIPHLIFALAFAIGLTLSLVDPVIAVCFMLANLFLRPWEVTGMPEMVFIPKTLGGLALFSWAFHRIKAKKFSMLFNWPSRLFLIFSVWVLLSAVTSEDFIQGLLAYSNTMLIATVLFLLVANVPENESDLQILKRTLTLSITGVIAHAIFMTIFQDGFDSSIHRLMGIGLTGNANDLAALIALALPIAIIPAVAGRKKSFPPKLLAVAVLPFFLIGLWLAQSRGAILSVGLSGLCYFVLRARNRRRAVFLVVLALPLMFASFSLLNFARNADDIQSSTDSRFSFMRAGINMAIHHPIAGVGFSNFPKLFDSYASYDIEHEGGERTAHSTWILALAETGFPGFFLIVGIFITTFRRAWRIQIAHPELFASMAGYGLAMSFLSHTYTFFPYVLFALVLAGAKFQPPPEPQATPSSAFT